MVISEVFRSPQPTMSPDQQATLLETLQAGIVRQLEVLEDPSQTGLRGQVNAITSARIVRASVSFMRSLDGR